MVRLVFRPYTQIWRSICTSEPLRASTRVSSGFTLFRHSSPSFGSQQIRSYSNLSKKIQIGRWCAHFYCALTSAAPMTAFTFISPNRVCHPKTCAYVRLLGPCFKTGRLKPFRQHPRRIFKIDTRSWHHATPNHSFWRCNKAVGNTKPLTP